VRILLAAAAHGVGAALGHFTGPGDSWAASTAAKSLLGIPDERLVREIISLGYPAERLEPTPTRPDENHSINSCTGTTTSPRADQHRSASLRNRAMRQLMNGAKRRA
jgi:hypothetical protein